MALGELPALGVVLEEFAFLALPMGGVGSLAQEALTTWRAARVVRARAAPGLSVSFEPA